MHSLHISRGLALFSVLTLLAGCEDSTATCVPGASAACTCSTGATGAQTCDADGRYGACRCDGVDAGSTSDAGDTQDDAGRPRDGGRSDDAGRPSDAGPPDDGVLFVEDFDDQPDWTSGDDTSDDGSPARVQYASMHTIPEGWYAVRQDPAFSPSMGFSEGHESIEILASNAEMARGGAGKSMVMWRDSNGPDWYWGSDSMMSVYFPEGHHELYVRFWIRFDPDWTPNGDTGLTKLFRFSSWHPELGNIYRAFSDGANGPILIWDYQHNSYGVRNPLAFRAHPMATNYGMSDPPIINLPREGNTSMNFDDDIRDLDGDGVDDNVIDDLRNLVTGEPVAGIVGHDELWGDAWHQVEFHVRMNSGPGVYDGVLQQWLDGELIFRNVTVPWRGNGSEGDPRWNVVTFGGNSHFHAYDESDRRQEWRAIDDILIRDSLPPERR